MTPQNHLEINGNFSDFPLAEIFAEIAQSRLDGSLRFSHEAQKNIAYFRSGKLVYVVSNARSAKLFDILLRENRIDKKTLTEIPNFTNDFELGKALVERNICSEIEIQCIVTFQIEKVLQESFSWTKGDWNFNPLAKLRDGIAFDINLPKLMFQFGRNLSGEQVIKRFRSLQETFAADANSQTTVNLNPQEGFILSRFSESPITIEEIKQISGFSDEVVFQTLYTLWLGGFLTRKNWDAAFSERQIAHIKTAKLSLVKKPQDIPERKVDVEIPKDDDDILDIASAENSVEIEISLEDYLDKTEKARNHYEILGIEINASTSEIKKSYFHLAKRFHPDLFQRNAKTELFQRIQGAFSKLAGAYETLRDKDSREFYDFKIRKELAEMADRANENQEVNDESFADLQETAKTALIQFEEGYRLFLNEEYEEALPYLARAVSLDSQNARYQAFYGKVLQFDSRQRHKAEQAIQAAIKLDPSNETYRIILAEFFIKYGLLKRAEGELKRLLDIAPNNLEAKNMLEDLKNN